MNENEVSNRVIGAAIEVHKILGPGLLESAYQTCLERELQLSGLNVETEIVIPVDYKGIFVGEAYRVDMLVENKLLVELKALACIQDIHKAQLLTYLRLTNRKLGLLINFNELVLKNGIKRIVNKL